ncbi:hypothetical protein AB6A40_009286 [Gnathostoma spinigerum]|uniref:Uncharacterized protein n=1 Tax=Gnathostoma spinigerum TaxID=75299 RepID=A0ABD6F0D7_9BILA
MFLTDSNKIIFEQRTPYDRRKEKASMRAQRTSLFRYKLLGLNFEFSVSECYSPIQRMTLFDMALCHDHSSNSCYSHGHMSVRRIVRVLRKIMLTTATILRDFEL